MRPRDRRGIRGSWQTRENGTQARLLLVVAAYLLSRGKSARERRGQMSKSGSPKASSRHHVPMSHGVEMALISPLIQSTNFNDDLMTECVNRGFLTDSLRESLIVAKFLSRTILAAQHAQRIYGVPASFLIAVGINESGWEADGLLEDRERSTEWLGCDCCYSPGIQKWFLEMAKLLAESPKYSEAMNLVSNVREYGEKLSSLGFRNRLDMEDILTPIKNYDLEQCDLAALCEPNEYDEGRLIEYRDKDGAKKLRSVLSDLLQPVARKEASPPVPETAVI